MADIDGKHWCGEVDVILEDGGKQRVIQALLVQTLVAYDFNDDTFDVAVLMLVDGVIAPLHIEGDLWLGSEQFTRRVIEKTLRHITAVYDIDPSRDSRFVFHLDRAARSAADALNIQTSADLVVAGVLRDCNAEIIDVEMEISRADYADLIRPAIERTLELTTKAVNGAGLELSEIDAVCLAGHGTRVPAVYEALERMFGLDKVIRDIDPDVCCALGAASIASQLYETVPETVVLQGLQVRALVDKTAPSYYWLKCDDDMVKVFAHKGDLLPTSIPSIWNVVIGHEGRRKRFPIFTSDDMQDCGNSLHLEGEVIIMIPPDVKPDAVLLMCINIGSSGLVEVETTLPDGRKAPTWFSDTSDPLLSRIRGLTHFANFIINFYGWALDSQQVDRLGPTNLSEDFHVGFAEQSLRVAIDRLPEITQIHLVGRAIRSLIMPNTPEVAAAFLGELERVEDAYGTNCAKARDILSNVVGSFVECLGCIRA